MTRVVRNKKNGKFLHIDESIGEAFEYEEPHMGTIITLNESELSNDDILETFEEAVLAYGISESPNLEVLQVKITCEIL